jgi:hypothetical protein
MLMLLFAFVIFVFATVAMLVTLNCDYLGNVAADEAWIIYHFVLLNRKKRP